MNRYGTQFWACKRWYHQEHQLMDGAGARYYIPAWERPRTGPPSDGFYGGPGGTFGGGPGFPEYTAGGGNSFSEDGIPDDNDDAQWTDAYENPADEINDVTPDRVNLYLLRNNPNWTGDNGGTINGWFGMQYKVSVDEPSIMEFFVDATDENETQMLFEGNIIWLFDRWRYLLDTLMITGIRKITSGAKALWKIECKSRIVRLAKEPVLNYSATDTVLNHVTALLALQQHAEPIVFGRVAPAIAATSIALTMRKGYVLGALQQLQKNIPKDLAGHFWTDHEGAFCWDESIGLSTVENLRVGEHIKGVDYLEDFDEMANRVYLYGAGEDIAHEVKLTDAGADQSNEYIEDAVSVTAHGMHPLIKKDDRIKHPETLLAAAQRILEESSEPRESVKTTTLDIAKADGSRFTGAVELFIGTQYRIIDTVQQINTLVRVVDITYSSENPLTVQVGLSNKRRRLSDFLRDFLDQMAARELDVYDDGTRYPNIGRTFENGFDDTPHPNLVYKDMDLRRLVDVPQWFHEGVSTWNNFTRAWQDTPDEPQPVGAEADRGDSEGDDYELVAHANHVHQGVVHSPLVQTSFPDIPTVGAEIILITKSGESQLWIAQPGDDEWTPLQRRTILDGLPPAP